MEWETPEYTHQEKGHDWYLAVVIVAGALVVTEVILHDIVLVVLTILATITFLLLAVRKPQTLRVVITEKGVAVGQDFFAFSSLKHFGIVQSRGGRKIMLESTKSFSPYIIIPLGDEDPEAARELLKTHIPEENLEEPLSHLIIERLGF
jgi:hypothetical protein